MSLRQNFCLQGSLSHIWCYESRDSCICVMNLFSTKGIQNFSDLDIEFNEDDPSCSKRIVVNINDDCRKLGIEKVPKTVAAPMVRYSK